VMKVRGEWKTRKIWISKEGEEYHELLPHKSQTIYNHSPDGFCWGYGGSGPSQLALALMLEVNDPDVAINYYQDFKWNVIAKLSQDDFEIECFI